MVALGAIPRTLPIPGLSEHALSFKSLADAIHLRNHVLHQLETADAALDEEERARRLTFVFVGAGYAGVEALAELSDLVEDALRYYPRLRSTQRRWVLVDAAPRILPEIPPRLGDYAAAELRRREVEIHVETTLASVSADEALLGNGTRIPTNTLVWTAGVAPNPALREWSLPLDEKRHVQVDDRQADAVDRDAGPHDRPRQIEVGGDGQTGRRPLGLGPRDRLDRACDDAYRDLPDRPGGPVQWSGDAVDLPGDAGELQLGRFGRHLRGELLV